MPDEQPTPPPQPEPAAGPINEELARAARIKSAGGEAASPPINDGLAQPVRPESMNRRTSPTSINLTPSVIENTDDQALWTAIRTTGQTMDFISYQKFIARVFDPSSASSPSVNGGLPRVFGVEAYQMLKFATQAYLILHSNLAVRPGADFQKDEGIRGNSWTQKEAEELLVKYLGGSDKRLPYLKAAIESICVCEGTHQATGAQAGQSFSRRAGSVLGSDSTTMAHIDSVYASKEHRMFALQSQNTLLLELIWSFWREEGGLVQTMNAISLRFQNRTGPGLHDPLGNLKLDSIRPLSNIIWGYIQDEPNRLTLPRRCDEYCNEYGLNLLGKAVPPLRSAESRSKFIEAFNNLLHIAYLYCKESDDMTVRADAFPVLNALKEVHHILAHGAHNQFGDLPWTARVEMLTQQWMLARPEIREFLSGPPMVTYAEPWMGQVETMRQLQGWSDVSVTHFRDLSTFGESLILGIRYGNWNNISTAANAGNWALYWRTEIQSYMHSYRAVTGVDLTSDISPGNTRNEQPAILHRRRVDMSRTRFRSGARRLNLR